MAHWATQFFLRMVFQWILANFGVLIAESKYAIGFRLLITSGFRDIKILHECPGCLPKVYAYVRLHSLLLRSTHDSTPNSIILSRFYCSCATTHPPSPADCSRSPICYLLGLTFPDFDQNETKSLAIADLIV